MSVWGVGLGPNTSDLVCFGENSRFLEDLCLDVMGLVHKTAPVSVHLHASKRREDNMAGYHKRATWTEEARSLVFVREGVQSSTRRAAFTRGSLLSAHPNIESLHTEYESTSPKPKPGLSEDHR